MSLLSENTYRSHGESSLQLTLNGLGVDIYVHMCVCTYYIIIYVCVHTHTHTYTHSGRAGSESHDCDNMLKFGLGSLGEVYNEILCTLLATFR